MDLTTNYLGLKLAHPIMPGASPLVDDLDVVRRLEDAGASAIVMHSLFQEQIEHAETKADPPPLFPRPYEFALDPNAYLEQVRRIKAAVKVPVIASINATGRSGCQKWSALIQEAGADAIELNIYYIPTDASESSADVEKRILDTARAIRSSVTIPIAVKLSPFFTSLANMVKRLDELNVDGVVLFNRIYQSDIDTELIEFAPDVHISSGAELPLRLRWLAILNGRVKASLAAAGGVHNAHHAVRAVAAGAHAVQVVSALLQRGPEYLKEMRAGLQQWMEEHHYESIKALRGSMGFRNSTDSCSFERGNYARLLQSWRG